MTESSSIKKPNFFLIGAPKCGTTSMSEYLRAHPDVFFSNPKEPHYFDIETRPVDRHFRTENDYLSLFKEAGNRKAIGEGTALSLYSKNAVPAMLQFNPEAKFIVMLRNPVDMVQSWHSQNFKMLRESVGNFEKAWRLQTIRALGKQVPLGCKRPLVLQYANVCSLGSQLERLYELVPRDRAHIVFFEDLDKNPLDTYKAVLDFLDIAYDGRTDFHVANPNKVVRGFVLRRILHFLFITRTRVAMWLTGSPVPTSFSLGLGRLISPFFYWTAKRTPISDDFRKELVAHFEPEVRKIEALTGRDLSAWRT